MCVPLTPSRYVIFKGFSCPLYWGVGPFDLAGAECQTSMNGQRYIFDGVCVYVPLTPYIVMYFKGFTCP